MSSQDSRNAVAKGKINTLCDCPSRHSFILLGSMLIFFNPIFINQLHFPSSYSVSSLDLDALSDTMLGIGIICFTVIFTYISLILWLIVLFKTYFYFLNFLVFLSLRAAPAAYGGSQARGLIGAVATSLHHSHSNSGTEPYLRLTPQLTASPDP